MKIKKLVTGTAIALTAAALVLGSAASSEAKAAKKKAEAAPHHWVSCMFTAPAPVCGSRGGMALNYRNACYAANDGAVVKSQGACKAAKAMRGMKGKHHGKKAAKKAGKKKM
jgi:hypothetical protein